MCSPNWLTALAGDFLSTLYLAFTGPVLLAPAMNVNMWQHPATRESVETLKRRGNRVIEPGSGYLACGMNRPWPDGGARRNSRCHRTEARQRRDLEGETVWSRRGLRRNRSTGTLHLESIQRQNGLRRWPKRQPRVAPAWC